MHTHPPGEPAEAVREGLPTHSPGGPGFRCFKMNLRALGARATPACPAVFGDAEPTVLALHSRRRRGNQRSLGLRVPESSPENTRIRGAGDMYGKSLGNAKNRVVCMPYRTFLARARAKNREFLPKPRDSFFLSIFLTKKSYFCEK